MSMELYDPFYSSDFQLMERQLGVMDRSEDNGEFKYTCNFQGFSPSDIKVHSEGKSVVLEAERKHCGNFEHYHRSLKRQVTLPDDVDEKSVSCEMNERGELIIHAPKMGCVLEDDIYRQIPLLFRESPRR